MKRTILSLALYISLIGSAFSQARVDTTFEIYILLGQSNMAGRGQITEDFKAQGHSRVFMLTKDNSWVLAKHPLHFDKPKAAGVGPGLSFGIDLAKAKPDAKIGLIPCAVGGTSIERWQPGAFDEFTQTHPYDDALLRIKTAMRSGIIKGIIWHQGEANSSDKKSAKYLTQLKTLIARIRKDVGNPELPFIVGELGRYKMRYAQINSQLAKVPGLIPFTELATSENLIHKGDSTHFDGPSANELGHRFAEKMLKVQRLKPR